jgi:hypothetical protein
VVDYKPNTQKSLFHKDLVNHIRKWIINLEQCVELKQTAKHILFLSGPIGSGKSVCVDVLFKNFELINVDSDNIRSIDKINEILQLVVGFNTMTLTNIEKWNHKNKKDKSNIVLVDNIELCEKTIQSFVDNIHVKHNINVPIILISNNVKYKDIFSSYANCTFIDFKTPSLLEMTKLTNDINKDEKLELTKDMIKELVTKSQFDTRQLLFLLEQWNLSKSGNFQSFITSIDIKFTDQDLSDKLENIFNSKKTFDLENSFIMSCSDPQVVSHSIYQNYINIDLDSSHSIHDSFNIIEEISLSNIIHNQIYENQNWELYNDYAFQSCVMPSYYINKAKIKKPNKFSPFKDVSYNFINSFDEVKKVCQSNELSNKLNVNHNNTKTNTISDYKSCFLLTQIFINCLNHLNSYFDTNKKGKNTTKKEKLDLCNNIKDGLAKTSMDFLVDNIYNYKLFEIDIDDFIINRSKYINDDYIKDNISKIDLRIFKRLLNIFTFDDSNKSFKSHTETSIKYKILHKLINEFNNYHSDTKDINTIDNLMENLDDIWNLT